MAYALETLGTFALSIDGKSVTPPPTQKARALLVYLACRARVEVTRDAIIEIFWPDCEPERGRSSLNTALWSIRRCLRETGFDADAVIDANKTRIVWTLEMDVDLPRFERLANSGNSEDQRAAIALYRGEFLAGDYSEWSVATRERAESTYDVLLRAAVERDSDLESARRLVERGSFDEGPYTLLARAELDAGRAASAAAILARGREMLKEIGVAPTTAFETAAALVPARSMPTEVSLPFCGRIEEIATLAHALQQAAQGRGSVSVVQGAAGAGKSALLERATKTASSMRVRMLNVACVEDDVRTYGPWAQLYENVSGKPFESMVMDGVDAARLADRLLPEIGSRVVLVVDDAQFLEGDAFEVLMRLAQRTGVDQGICLIIATRPEGVRRLLGSLRDPMVIELRELSVDEIRDALAQIAERGVNIVAAALHARSGGHAFFAARLLDSYVNSGAMRVKSGEWIVTPGREATPTSIRKFIEARLYARGERTAIVACALALEHDATAEDLVEVCGVGEAGTFDAIDDLLSLGLVEQPESGPEFRFNHDLIRETAARALNSGRRVRLHRAFAARYEADERIESQVRYARHLRASGQVLAAARASAAAAKSVLLWNAWRDALSHARTGIELARDLRISGVVEDLLETLHAVATRAAEDGGLLDEALAHAAEAIAYARRSKDAVRISSAHRRRASILIDVMRPGEARLDLDASLEAARRSGDSTVVAAALRSSANCWHFLGDMKRCLSESREGFELALEHSESTDIAPAAQSLLCNSIIVHEFEEARWIADVALTHARAAHGRVEVLIRVRRADLFLLCDDLAGAENELHAASSILDAPEGAPATASIYVATLGFLRFVHRMSVLYLALARERWDDAIATSQEILANPFTQMYERAMEPKLGHALALLGRNAPGDAETAHSILSSITCENGENGLIGMSLHLDVLRACVNARLRKQTAPAGLVRAAAIAQAQAERTPLDFDRAFALLAQVGSEIGLNDFAQAMTQRSQEFRERRLIRATAQHSKTAS